MWMGVARGISGPIGIGCILCSEKEEVLLMFSEYEDTKNSNEAEVLTILEAVRIYLWIP